MFIVGNEIFKKSNNMYTVRFIRKATRSDSYVQKCLTIKICGIRVVGKGSWKEREVGKFEVGKFEVGKSR